MRSGQLTLASSTAAAKTRRDNDMVDQVPYWCFVGGASCLAIAEQYSWCKPPASRVAELAGLFANSQARG